MMPILAVTVKNTVPPTTICVSSMSARQHCPGANAFYDQRCSTVFNAISQAHARGHVDLVAVGEQLAETRTFGSKTDALDFAAKCADGVPSAANVRHYARIVATHWRTRRAIIAMESAVHEAHHGDAEDAISIAHETLADILAGGKNTEVSVADAAQHVIDEINRGTPQCIQSTVPTITKLTGGLPLRGVLTILGIPSSGKTTLALALARDLADHVPVRIFSFEQNAPRIAASLLTAAAGTAVHQAMSTGRKPDSQAWCNVLEAAERLKDVDLAVVDDNLDPRAIYNRAMAMRRRGVRAIVVDYIQNLPPADPRMDRTRALEDAMRWLQRIYRDLDMLVIAVSQVDKHTAKEHKPPKISDGFGSAAIEQASDMMITVHRPGQFSGNASARDMHLALVKNKYGPLNESRVQFDLANLRFEYEHDSLRAQDQPDSMFPV